MKKFLIATYMTVISTTTLGGVPMIDVEMLSADFNNRVPGTSIGSGGAALGEPVNLGGLNTEIIEVSPGQNILLIDNDLPGSSAQSVKWEFLADAEFSTGKVVIAFDFTPSELDSFGIGLRENGGSSKAFIDLIYSASGDFVAIDPLGVITLTNNSYSAGLTQHVELTFDMDAGTSEMIVNGSTLYSDRAHGITDRGVGRLLIGYNSNSDFQPFTLDNLNVTGDIALPLILDVDLEDKVLGQSIGEGGALAGEPALLTSDIDTEVIANFNGGQSVELTNIATGSASKGIIWEFLNTLEILSGILIVEMDIEFTAYDQYRFTVNDLLVNGTVYTSLTFNTDGSIDIGNNNHYYQEVGFYQLNQRHTLQIKFDLDSGIYSVFLDDDVLIDEISYGLAIGTGIARVRTGFYTLSNTNSSFIIDDFQVGSSYIADDIIYQDGFE